MTDEKPKRLEPYPQSDDRSPAYHVARTILDAGASLVPGAGYAVGELVKHFIGEPLEKRREEWFTSLGEGVIELQGRLEGFDPRDLGENQEFISAVYEATQHAMKTHHAEKHEALRNAVLNVARGYHIDEIERSAFLAAIDRFTPLHVKVLRILADPKGSPEYMQAMGTTTMASKPIILQKALGADRITEETLNRVLSDIGREGFTNGSERGGMSRDGLSQPATNPAGDRFLRFISDPPAQED